jgi:hypothetical protein
MIEGAKLLFGAGRAEITRRAFIYRISGISRGQKERLGQAAVV